ncbi:dihydroneopterin aldolase [bacterium]|nr:dihydroneopterin aldolase [bacterium]
MDKVRVKGIEAYGYHGVYAEERTLGQTLVVDVEVGCDLREAGLSDDIHDSISYVDLVKMVKEVVSETQFQLLEAIAETIAARVLDVPRAQNVVVRVEKPRAPIPHLTGTVSIEIVRQKG